jgi:hypothetical protein
VGLSGIGCQMKLSVRQKESKAQGRKEKKLKQQSFYMSHRPSFFGKVEKKEMLPAIY